MMPEIRNRDTTSYPLFASASTRSTATPSADEGQAWYHRAKYGYIPVSTEATTQSKHLIQVGRLNVKGKISYITNISPSFCHRKSLQLGNPMSASSKLYILGDSWRQPEDLCREPGTNLRAWKCRLCMLNLGSRYWSNGLKLKSRTSREEPGAGIHRPRYNRGVTVSAVANVIVTSSVTSNVKYITLMTSNVKSVSIFNVCWQKKRESAPSMG